MTKYENVICPGCKKPIGPDDDVVVCPDCGTPMHRACWQAAGQCANAAKHGTGFVWKMPYDPKRAAEQERQEKELEERRRRYREGTDAEENRGGFFGMGYDDAETGDEGRFGPNMRVIGPDEKIGEHTVREYGSVIRRNQRKYIPRFFIMEKTGRKYSWNWAAVFFPILWLTYRKLYKEAVIALIISVILPFAFMSKVYNYYSSMTEYLMSPAVTVEDTTDETTEEVVADNSDSGQPMALVVNSYVTLAVQLIVGLFGNYWVRKRCDKILADAAKRDGPEEEKAKYIAKKGGVSAISVLLAILVIYVLFTLVLGITLRTGTDLATVIWRLFQ